VDIKPSSDVKVNDITVSVAHSAIWLAPTDQDGPLKWEYGLHRNRAIGLYFRIFDQGLVNKDKVLQEGKNQKIYLVGETEYRNEDIYDHATRSGLAIRIFKQDRRYQIGPKYADEIIDCNALVRRSIGPSGLNLQIDPHVAKILDQIWQSSAKWEAIQDVGAAFEKGPIEVKIVGYRELKDGKAQTQFFVHDDPDKGPMKTAISSQPEDIVTAPEFMAKAPKEALVLDPGGNLGLVEADALASAPDGPSNTKPQSSNKGSSVLGGIVDEEANAHLGAGNQDIGVTRSSSPIVIRPQSGSGRLRPPKKLRRKIQALYSHAKAAALF